MKKASVSVFFDKRRMKDGQSSVKLSVYFNDQQKLVPTGIVLPEKDVEFLKKNKIGLSGKIRNEDQRNLWNRVYGQYYFDDVTGKVKESLLFRAQKAISDLDVNFSFEEFNQMLLNDFAGGEIQTDLLKALDARVNQFAEEEKYNREGIYRSARQSMIRYITDEGLTSKVNPKLPMKMITTDFLNRYEKYMLTRGGTDKTGKARRPVKMTTVAYYTKCFSDVLQRALEDKVIPETNFPIGKRGYKIPKGRKPKKALDSAVISKILRFDHPNQDRMHARDMWAFSYYCNGINFADICRLRWSNFSKDLTRISFVRNKTKDTKEEKGLTVVIRLLPQVKQIIERWAAPKNSATDYVFDFISVEMTEREKTYQVRKTINQVNYQMALIAKELGIESDVTTYVARHSFATTLLRSDVPLPFISQSLGHSSLSTTQDYLGAFEDEQTQRYMNALIPGDDKIID
ncbi:site-specific integrase [Dyadobacter chenwenxiniae]|uniref:Site-specific integrase n=1 Tax=Dyadobacter chenwenxiniae TaxID=2906456 RepID=A0A9X1TCI0_9BACT|nr:site-specific integrase [Dyadobacter chenwenxiniae]MCF0060102.1 site-specific integrase [Dyadobacter chenwenxiniae]UON85840.1 site-specific integrase [Dyadobacter chenwenxiniae]